MRLTRAVSAFQAGHFHSQSECALVFRVSRSSLQRALRDPDYKFKGKGVSKVLSKFEEDKVRNIIVERTNGGSIVNIRQVQDLIHEFLLQAVRDDPIRLTPWAHKDPPHYPPRAFVERFLSRQKLMDKVLKYGPKAPNSCNICGQSYPLRQSLIEHKRNVHFGC